MDKIKLYRPVYLAFSSLRDGVGYNLGIIHDCDVTVFRKAMRVIDNKEIRWQLLDEDMFCRSANENDLTCLNEYEEFKVVSKKVYLKGIYNDYKSV